MDSTYSENGNVNVAAADHAKRLGRVKARSAGDHGDCFLASVDNITTTKSVRCCDCDKLITYAST